MSWLRVRDLRDSTHSGPEGHGQLTGSLSIVSVGGLLPTR